MLPKAAGRRGYAACCSGEGVGSGASGTVDGLDWLQWPAMAVTLLASWLVASRSERRRRWGFWVFLASNLLWGAWGWQSGTWALIALQVGLAAMNIRGARRNAREARDERDERNERDQRDEPDERAGPEEREQQPGWRPRPARSE